MRAAGTLLSLAACYAPSPPLGVPCTDSAGCPAGQVCVAEVCARPGTSTDPDALLPDGPLDEIPADWWDPRWKRRRPIDLTALAPLDAGYAFSITFDHGAQVAAGRSLASGEDLRIVRADGVEVARVLDTGAAFASASTTLWFATPDAIDTSARFYLYSDNPAATAAPDDASQVFVVAEGFEGSLAAWTVDAKVEQTTTRAHRGTRSLFIAEPQFQTGIGAKRGLGMRDLVFDAWWNIDTVTGADLSQLVRINAASNYFTNLQPPGPVFDLSKIDNGTYSQLIPAPQGSAIPTANVWFRVTVYAYERSMAVDIDGERYVPASGFAQVDAAPSGGIGLQGYIVPSHVWWDDATVRPLVLPEPTVALGVEQLIP